MKVEKMKWITREDVKASPRKVFREEEERMVAAKGALRGYKDWVGERVDRLTILEFKKKLSDGRRLWLAVCDCGTRCAVKGDQLVKRKFNACPECLGNDVHDARAGMDSGIKREVARTEASHEARKERKAVVPLPLRMKEK